MATPENGSSNGLYLILGDGQLGRMEIPSTHQYGIETATYGPNPKDMSPAGRLAAVHYEGKLDDANKIYAAGQDARVISYEIEHLPIEPLQQLSNEGKLVHPYPESLRVIQDKLWQKEAVEKLGIPTARFQGVGGKADVISAAEQLGYPLMLKSRRQGYDGGGNYVITDIDHVDEGVDMLSKKSELYVEEFIPFVGEAAVSVARDRKGHVEMYPVLETYHENNICHTVVYPARFDRSIVRQGRDIGRKAIQLLQGPGLLAVEMFVTEDGRVLYNEAAPRAHNSGHLLTEASRTSQFEQHMRAVNGMPLGSPEMIVPAAAMVNILGRGDQAPSQEAIRAGVYDAMIDPELSVTLYGKSWRENRKLGHVVRTSQHPTHALTRARIGRDKIAL